MFLVYKPQFIVCLEYICYIYIYITASYPTLNIAVPYLLYHHLFYSIKKVIANVTITVTLLTLSNHTYKLPLNYS